MLKKATILATAIALLLATAQLALAQQDTVGTPTAGEGQTTPADTSGQNPSQTQPAVGSQDSPSSVAGLMHLNKSNELVVDCTAVSNELAQLQAAPANDSQSQAELVGAENLSQLCAESGFTPSSGGGGTGSGLDGTGSTPPQQSQSGSTPSNSEGNNGSNPSVTDSTQPQQAQETTSP